MVVVSKLLPNLQQVVSGADLLLVVADLGSLTGCLAAAAAANLAKHLHALTLAVVRSSVPSSDSFAGQQGKALNRLLAQADCVLVVSAGGPQPDCELKRRKRRSHHSLDEAVCHALAAITGVLAGDAMVRCDLDDVRVVLRGGGIAAVGTGAAKGEGRACLAATRALSCFGSCGAELSRASGLLIQITGGPDLRMKEVSQTATVVTDQASENANVIFGARSVRSLGSSMRVTILATGTDIVAP